MRWLPIRHSVSVGQLSECYLRLALCLLSHIVSHSWSSRGSPSLDGNHPLDLLRTLFGPSGVSFSAALLACALHSVLCHLEDLAAAHTVVSPSTSTSSSSSERYLSSEEATALPINRLSLPPSIAPPRKLHFGIPLFFLALLTFSAFRLPETTHDLARTQAVQLGCVAPSATLDRSSTEAREALLHASRVRASYGDQLIVWPESALLLHTDTQEHQLWHAASSIARAHGVALLLTYTFDTRTIGAGDRIHRSALFTPAAARSKPLRPQLIYDKLHPLPFVESGIIPGVRGANTSLITFALPGKKTLEMSVGVAICHDVSFPPSFEPHMPQLIVSPAWSAPYAAASHSLAALRDRAVESGAAAGFRCDGALAGITAAVDARGRVRGVESGVGGSSVKLAVRVKEGENGAMVLDARVSLAKLRHQNASTDPTLHHSAGRSTSTPSS